MPELPEVETIRRGITPLLTGQRILGLEIRNRQLRWPIATELEAKVAGARVQEVSRRAKYLLLHLDMAPAACMDTGATTTSVDIASAACVSTGPMLIIHLGMSGSLRIVGRQLPPERHDHFDLVLETGLCLRFRDPRRFGALLWHTGPAASHPLLRDLGPEPLTAEFDGLQLSQAAKGRRVAIKTLLMDSKTIAGVGNIYASEALFLAGLHPLHSCQNLTLPDFMRLATAIKQVLTQALEQGGTTLRDFSQADGRPGYFVNFLQVYGRTGEKCYRCNTPIVMQRIGQRASFFCPHCQASTRNLCAPVDQHDTQLL